MPAGMARKRTEFRFLPNLRSSTLAEGFRSKVRSGGYLIPPQTATTGLAKAAASVRGVGRLLVDNGNFSRIAVISRGRASKGAELFGSVQRLETSLKRSVEARDLSAGQRQMYRDLAEDVLQAVRSSDTSASNLRRQLERSPTHLVGDEDITVATWLSLNIEEEYLGYPPRYYGRLNSVVASAATKSALALPPRLRARFYPVASALSYDSAFEAGRAFAEAKVNRMAMGFGAYMADDNYRDHLYVRRRRVGLPGRFPNRYVRTAAAALGFWDGYRAVRGSAPAAFHFLGLGAPIMFPIVALCAWGTRDISFDATSPFRDAGEGFLYVSVPAYLKLRTRKVAFAIASGRRSWDCPCAFCEEFALAHPFDYARARTWHDRRKRTEVQPADLRPGGGLFEALPLLSEPKAGKLRTAVDLARMGHNHWVLEEVVKELRRNASSRQKLEAHGRKVITNYVANTGSEQFARAMTWVIDFVCRRGR